MNGPSVIICSRNRAHQLRECLARIPHPAFAQFEVELILVDNASTDETNEIMQAHATQAPYPVKVLLAAQPGLGLARNVGIAAASRELLVFTDDDCYIEEQYIERLLQDFDKNLFQFCGGRILLWDEMDAREAVNYRDQFILIPAGSFLPAGLIQGANMVVHQQVIEKIGGFNPYMGAGTPLRCEDIEFLGRACMNGFSGAHLPQLVVYHHHRRQLAPEIEQLQRENSIGRGAYYAAMSDQGYPHYWLEGMKLSLTDEPKNYQRLINELLGAQYYFEMKAKTEI